MQYKRSQQQIKKLIDNMSGKYNRYDIFRDFIVLSACTISNSVDKAQWQKREDMYMGIIRKYSKEEANKFTEMLALMVLAYESRMGDFIGELYMTMEFGNKHAGQFFTPYDVSRMMSSMIYKSKKQERIITLNEPSCGSGGMIVAFAEAMRIDDRNYQTDLRVVCNDLDYDAVRMCYVQLSLLGVDAVVYQKNTLEPLDKPPGETWYTPMHFMNLAKEKQVQENDKTKRMVKAMQDLIAPEEPEKDEKEPVLAGPPGQMDIFDFLGGS